MPRFALRLVLALAVPSAGLLAQAPLPYRDARRPLEERVRDLMSRMTLEEKFWQLYMSPGGLADSALLRHGVFGLQVATPGERINDIQRFAVERTRLGIPIIPFDEAVHGLMRPGATVFPQAIALAATWDTALMSQVAEAIAQETRERGVRQVLSPVVNLARDVRWGRVEETYGEDPYLASRMGVAFVGAFERAGVVATPKHFVANVGDGGRDSYPIDLDERELDEVYFPPFESAIHEGHARSLMTAYNSVNGVPATQNRWLLTDKLKREWGFSGFVISDAAATGGPTVLQLTEPNTPTAAADAWNAGLDVVFQSTVPQYRPYWDAVQRGLVPVAVIDSAVARVLRVKFALGLFEHPYADSVAGSSPAHQALARTAAREAIVLLKNDHDLLPLARTVKSIAVIGADAVDARLGGYSGPGVHPVSILDGLRAKGAAVTYAPGPGRLSPTFTTIPSSAFGAGKLVAAYFGSPSLPGEPVIVRTDSMVDFAWTLNGPAPGIPRDWYAVRWTGSITVPTGGVRHIGVDGSDGYRLYLDGQLVIDDWRKVSHRALLAPVTFAPGSTHALALEFFETTGNGRVKLVWDAGVPDDWRTWIDSAVAVARASDVAIVVAGTEEGEFRDRASLALPGHQEELIEAVAATGKPVIVVLVAGSAVTMSHWIDQVGAVLDAWYPGEEGGDAVADVLFGDADPAGRLPITFPIAEGQLPLFYDHTPTGRGDDYVDLTGQPLFPFGYGLSYTSFEYSRLAITPAAIDTNGTVVIRCTVQNTGTRAGDEVVQLYLHDILASVARPVEELHGFQRIHLNPGESREVAFTLAARDLRFLDRDLRWVVEPGTIRVLVGGSSKDIRLRGDLTVR
jgi:beta-glucosidase